jgi:hypothetical protein
VININVIAKTENNLFMLCPSHLLPNGELGGGTSLLHAEGVLAGAVTTARTICQADR